MIQDAIAEALCGETVRNYSGLVRLRNQAPSTRREFRHWSPSGVLNTSWDENVRLDRELNQFGSRLDIQLLHDAVLMEGDGSWSYV
jgi:hypothetical protein